MEVRCASESVKLHNATCGVAHTACVVPHGLGPQSLYVETRVEWASPYTRAEFYGRFVRVSSVTKPIGTWLEALLRHRSQLSAGFCG